MLYLADHGNLAYSLFHNQYTYNARMNRVRGTPNGPLIVIANLPMAAKVDLRVTLSTSSYHKLANATYNKPRRRIPHTASFCGRGICKFQTMGIGVIKIAMSVTMSKTTRTSSCVAVSSQYVLMVFTLLHHAQTLEPHWKAVEKRKARHHAAMSMQMKME